MNELELFIAALRITYSAERSAFLDRECGGDVAMRRRIDVLLQAHEGAGSFLESSEAQPTSTATRTIESEGQTPRDHSPAMAPLDRTLASDRAETPSVQLYRAASSIETAGSRIGHYKLERQIGEGGMGVVYLAEQEKPVRRTVAIKIIKPGMDTAQVVARFEAERQALAMMDHPSIARVFDAGATDTGRPYFVMELVNGVPITEYCDAVHLNPKERLELFVPVCQAIQHAHQKGIIHRDVKPSNVLIAIQDGKPVPKVIDFGIAKAIAQPLTEKSLFTQHGAIVGTLEYMSPEQAQMSAMDVDTRTDIYALGVLLYELLTGTTPLDRAKLRQSGYAEILKRIREEELAKPSTRLSESKHTLASVAAVRKIEPSRLARMMKRDLDWIVMKSLEKDRTRRYETANGFARDVERYLEGDPVEACPPSASYKLRKFAHKHRAALATAGAFAFLVLAATVLSAWLALWANRERVRAVVAEAEAREQAQLAVAREQMADRERDRAVKAEARAKEQQVRAQEREQIAIDAVKRFGDVVRETPELKNNPSLAPLRAALLKEPQAFFRKLRERLQAERETTPDSLNRLAMASFDLGKLTNEIGDKQEALLAYEESRAICERLVRESPRSPCSRTSWQ
jgi:serine/threonine protein kinase